MALEDAILRLARAAEENGSGVAVKEIIRQRDEALNSLAKANADRDWYKKRLDSVYEERNKANRTIIGLRGAMARWKRK